MIFFENCPVTQRSRFDYDKVVIHLSCKNIQNIALPGQFLEIRVPDGSDPLLRRPYSIAGVDREGLWLIIQEKGKGSRKISRAKELEVLGPLGKEFKKQDGVTLIGGGSGIAPVIFYYKRYPDTVKKVLLGFRTLPEINWMGILTDSDVLIVTEDGSSGFRGLVTDFLKDNNGTFFACGPTPMMKALKNKISPDRLYLSLESYMGCGTGICMGCAVKRANQNGYFRVCTDGPIFRADEIEL